MSKPLFSLSMGAEANTSVSGVWAKLEGQVVDDQFPLRRYLGGSEHSGVFLSESAHLAPSHVALKLLSVPSERAQSQLARWHVAAAFPHPHLIGFLDVGRCDLAGAAHLYAVMEYAEEDLAQLLQRRALTEEETREMLVPILSALAFLHERDLVLGRMRPSNVLVVGDQLKLASDGIRPVGQLDDVRAVGVYDPPEAHEEACSAASDVWALGVTMCEALTRRHPLGLLGGAGSVVLPPDLPLAFREIVAWCLRRDPQDRPEVADIDAWLSGQSTVPDVVLSEPHRVLTELPATPLAPAPSAAEQVVASTVDVELAAGLEATSVPKTAQRAQVSATSKRVPDASKSAPAAPAAAASTRASKPVSAAPAPTTSKSAPATATGAATPKSAPTTATGAATSKFVPTTATGAATSNSSAASKSAPRVPGNASARSKGVSGARTSTPPTAAKTAPRSMPRVEPAPRPALRVDGIAGAPPPRRSLVPLALSFVVLIAVVWGVIREFSTDPAPAAPLAEAANGNASSTGATASGSNSNASLAPPTGSGPTPLAPRIRAPRTKAPAIAGQPRATSTSEPGGARQSAGANASSAGIHEVIPNVPDSARQTIRGHVRVSIRVLVQKDGTVFAALTDQRGPSRYFERLAIDAAKKWTFPPAASDARRLMLVKFVFTRDGTDANVTPLT